MVLQGICDDPAGQQYNNFPIASKIDDTAKLVVTINLEQYLENVKR